MGTTEREEIKTQCWREKGLRVMEEVCWRRKRRGEERKENDDRQQTNLVVFGKLSKDGGRVTESRSAEALATSTLDLEIPARGVILVVVQLPAPLNDIATRSKIRGDIEAATTRSVVSITVDLIAVLIVQLGNVGAGESRLVGVLGEDRLRHVDPDGIVGLVRLGVVLGRPADAHLLTSRGRSHGAEAASVGLGDGALAGLVCTGLDTVVVVGAGDKVLGVLLVVSAGGVAVETTELDTRVDGVLTGPAEALAIASAPAWLVRVVETPVDTVGPRVGLDHGGDKSEGSRDNDGGTEKHCDSTKECEVLRSKVKLLL